MRRTIEQDVLQVRAQALALVGIPFHYDHAGDDEASASEFESSVCCVGIDHLLTPAIILETAACRARCILAVLIAQAGQDVSEMDITLASLTQTRKVQLRARKRGIMLLQPRHKEGRVGAPASKSTTTAWSGSAGWWWMKEGVLEP
eukprot:scaffold20591_cov168-Skeletonema_marinoi.AAC.1